MFESSSLSGFIVQRVWLICDKEVKEVMAAVDSALAARVSRWMRLSGPKLEERVDWWVVRMDPAAQRVAHEQPQPRYVEWFPAPAGLASMCAQLRAADAEVLEQGPGGVGRECVPTRLGGAVQFDVAGHVAALGGVVAAEDRANASGELDRRAAELDEREKALAHREAERSGDPPAWPRGAGVRTMGGTCASLCRSYRGFRSPGQNMPPPGQRGVCAATNCASRPPIE